MKPFIKKTDKAFIDALMKMAKTYKNRQSRSLLYKTAKDLKNSLPLYEATWAERQVSAPRNRFRLPE